MAARAVADDPIGAARRRLRALGLDPRDVVEQFARSSGPGGQHVNKVSSGVTLRHAPTGLAATASESRSQFMNRRTAWLRLIETLEKQRADQRQQRRAALSKSRRQKARRSKAAKAKLVEGKRHRADTKKMRARVTSGSSQPG